MRPSRRLGSNGFGSLAAVEGRELADLIDDVAVRIRRALERRDPAPDDRLDHCDEPTSGRDLHVQARPAYALLLTHLDERVLGRQEHSSSTQMRGSGPPKLARARVGPRPNWSLCRAAMAVGDLGGELPAADVRGHRKS